MTKHINIDRQEMTHEEEKTDQIKTSIEYLADLIRENSGVYREYNDLELADAVWIFTEVLMAKMHDWHRAELSDEQMKKLVIEAGKSIRQTVKLFTGLDLHKVLK